MRWQHWAWVMTDEHSDEDWLALIAGRPRPGADAATQAEATALRAGLLSYREDAPDGELTAPAQRIDKLLHRGREAGVLAAARPDWRARLLAWWQRPQGLALAFSVVLGAGVLAMWPTTQPLPTAQERGASANQRITAADPPQRQRELLGVGTRSGGESRHSLSHECGGVGHRAQHGLRHDALHRRRRDTGSHTDHESIGVECPGERSERARDHRWLHPNEHDGGADNGASVGIRGRFDRERLD